METKCINGTYRCSQIGSSGGMDCCGILLASGETKLIDWHGNVNALCPFDDEKQINFKQFMEIVDGYRCRECKVTIGEGCKAYNCIGWKNLNTPINIEE